MKLIAEQSWSLPDVFLTVKVSVLVEIPGPPTTTLIGVTVYANSVIGTYRRRPSS